MTTVLKCLMSTLLCADQAKYVGINLLEQTVATMECMVNAKIDVPNLSSDSILDVFRKVPALIEYDTVTVGEQCQSETSPTKNKHK